MKSFEKNILLLLLVVITGCKETFKSKINNIEQKHLSPTSKNMNELKLGETIYFSYGETNGIDRSNYPAPVHSKLIDTSFFTLINTHEISDGADGGGTYHYSIYKAIKKGTTNITYTVFKPKPLAKIDPKYADTALVKDKTDTTLYKFVIR